MKIGIDISSLQGPHRMRGIGYVTKNFINNIEADTKDTFVFFLKNDINSKDIFKDLAISLDKYEVRYLFDSSLKSFSNNFLRLQKIIYKSADLLNYFFGSKRYGNVSDLDAFIQFDQSSPLARLNRGSKNYFIAYDLIPYILEKDYLWNYRTARRNNLSILRSIRKGLKRFSYILKIKLNSKKACKIFAISETTKKDFEKYTKVNPKKIKVINLGLDRYQKKNELIKVGSVNRYYSTSWGYITKKESLKNKRFILFIGGVDARRKLDDVVTAFNHLRAQGEDIKLVLSGDIMLGPKAITTELASKALSESSYINDIVFLGFTDDKTRDWLYKNALAFIFPSIYEGFGLPVLEAAQHNTPVISYNNKAIKEVAHNFPIYARDPLSIIDAIRYIMNMRPKQLEILTKKARINSNQYTWQKTTKTIINNLSK